MGYVQYLFLTVCVSLSEFGAIGCESCRSVWNNV